MKQYLLFDLDGTLTDPKVGITTCVQYALKELGIDEPDLNKLEPFIGPPLKDSFKEFYQMSDEQAERAVEKYRERFENIGIFENRIYDGIPQMLRTLQAKGLHLAVASSKPTVFVQRILEHFHIDKYFEVVVGSELDGTRVKKEEVVQETLRRLFKDKPIQRDKVYMIGDRRFDIEGAKTMHIDSVGVAYGYGSMDELKAAHADYIVRTVEELQKFLLRGMEDDRPKPTMFQKLWAILYNFMLFLIVRNLVQYICFGILPRLTSVLPEKIANFFVVMEEGGEQIVFTGNSIAIISAIGFIVAVILISGTAKFVIGKTAEDMHLTHLKGEPTRNYVLLGAVTVGFALGINIFFELIQLTSQSETYKLIMEDQYSAHLLVGLICYGVITPIAEEILFRGVVYNYIRRFWNVSLGILISSLVFALYHMNSVQGTYAFVMGCLMAYAYEYFGSFKIPVLMHITANLMAYLLTYTGIAVTAFISWPVCIVLLAAGAAGLVLLMRQKNVL
ncbi:MAG: HAD hydrolase-like protein [Acetatifactor sp.]